MNNKNLKSKAKCPYCKKIAARHCENPRGEQVYSCDNPNCPEVMAKNNKTKKIYFTLEKRGKLSKDAQIFLSVLFDLFENKREEGVYDLMKELKVIKKSKNDLKKTKIRLRVHSVYDTVYPPKEPRGRIELYMKEDGILAYKSINNSF